MNIVADQNIPFVKEAFSGLGTVTTVPGRSITKEQLENCEIMLVRSVTPVGRDLLDGTGVRFVASATTGTDHVDLDFLREQSIGFAYAPGSNADSVAQYVLSALFVIAQKQKKPISSLKLGIIGIGNIGSRLYRMAQVLGMECFLNDPPKKKITGSDIYQPLESVLENADVVSLHVPLITKGDNTTYHLVNLDFFSKVKKGISIINTSRGKIIDEKALRAQQDSIGCLVMDVWDNEPEINNETVKMTLIATPHIAGYSYDGKLRGTQMIHDAACAFFFKKDDWKVPQDSTDSAEEIDCSSVKDPLFHAVSTAYPIMNDDSMLRKLLTLPKEQQGSYFDECRKKYPKRREFSHWKVTGVDRKIAEQCSKLGFVI